MLNGRKYSECIIARVCVSQDRKSLETGMASLTRLYWIDPSNKKRVLLLHPSFGTKRRLRLEFSAEWFP